MTLPGDPKIKVNPPKDERATLPEWLEVEEIVSDVIEIRHMISEGSIGSMRIARRDACTLSDWMGAYLWKPGDEKDTANQSDDGEPELSDSAKTGGSA